jgi:3-hydroxymyristoyl/3-hydroxydecanoyl-(acyl carrier protein) dehydratase
MPGVMIIEAMAQTGCILILNELGDTSNKLGYFASIKEAKMRKACCTG